MCIASSGTAAVHALSYPLGGKYRIAHGVSNAILLPHVMDFNRDVVSKKLSIVAEAMGIASPGSSEEENAQGVVQELYNLADDFAIPGKLTDYGICTDELDVLVDAACKVTRLLENNPKQLSREDIANIYRKLL